MEITLSPEWHKFIALIPLFLVYGWMAWKNRKGFIEGLKGENHSWDLPEIIVLFWIPTWLGVIIVDVFFDKHASPTVWGALDLVLLFALGLKGFTHGRNNDKQKTDESSN